MTQRIKKSLGDYLTKKYPNVAFAMSNITD